MKLFLSWSQERSKKIAERFKVFVAEVLEDVDCIVSSKDFEYGRHWIEELEDALSGDAHGIIFLTKENFSSPWIHFEMGAISKTDKGLIIPILCDPAPLSITAPLKEYQHLTLKKNEIKKLVFQLRKACGMQLAENADTNQRFDKAWKKLKVHINKILSTKSARPVGLLEYDTEEDAQNDIRRYARQAKRAKILLLRGEKIVSDQGLLACLAEGGDLASPGLEVKLLLLNVLGEGRNRFDTLSDLVGVPFSTYDDELAGFQNRSKLISRLNKKKKLLLEARVYRIREFPYLKMVIFDDKRAFFTFYHRRGMQNLQYSGMFRVDEADSSTLFLMLKTVFNKVWNHSKPYDKTLTENREKVVISAAIRTRKGLLLLRRRIPYGEISSGVGEWELPGGKIELRDGPLDTLSKELAEEVGVSRVVDPKLIGAFKYSIAEEHEKSFRLHLLYELHMAVFEPRLSAEHDKYCYIVPDRKSINY